MVITGLTRNQFASNRTRVRIPPSPPKTLENTTFSRVFTLSWWCPLFVNGALGALICGALGVLLYSVYSSKMNTVVPLWCPNVLKTYVCPKYSEELHRHITFRDFLRSNPEAVKKYSLIKEKAAELFPHDIDGYIEYKSPCIEELYKECGLK